MKQKNIWTLSISILCSFNQIWSMEEMAHPADALLAKRYAAEQFKITDATTDAKKIRLLYGHVKAQTVEIPKLTLLGFSSIVVTGTLVAYAYPEKFLGGIALCTCGGLGFLKTALTTWLRKNEHKNDVALLAKAGLDPRKIIPRDCAVLTEIGKREIRSNMTNMNVKKYTGACTLKSSFSLINSKRVSLFPDEWNINDNDAKRLVLVLGGQCNYPTVSLVVNNTEL
jgi:hypothetical protein